MKTQPKDHEAIITLLTRIYFDIVAIEEQFQFLAGDGDMRPRIEYFHDAVRVFVAEDLENSRLNVELLSYDLRCLRYIQSNPFSPFREGGENLSPSHDIMTTDINIADTASRPDRKIRAQLIDLYQHYAVMFSALLKPAADHNYKERIDILDNEVSTIQSIIEQFEKKTNVNLKAIAQLAQQLEEVNLRIIIIKFLQEKKHKNGNDVRKLVGHLKKIIEQKNKKIKTIEDSHLNFASAQLGIFEGSKDMLKKLASQGMNIVGKFVENSVADTKRQMGR